MSEPVKCKCGGVLLHHQAVTGGYEGWRHAIDPAKHCVIDGLIFFDTQVDEWNTLMSDPIAALEEPSEEMLNAVWPSRDPMEADDLWIRDILKAAAKELRKVKP